MVNPPRIFTPWKPYLEMKLVLTCIRENPFEPCWALKERSNFSKHLVNKYSCKFFIFFNTKPLKGKIGPI